MAASSSIVQQQQQLLQQQQHHDSDVLFVNFSQDASSLAVGTRRGYALYSLTNVDELQKIHESKDIEETCLIERLFSSSLVTLVSQSAPRKLRVCHFQKGTEICSHSYTNAILSVRLNRLRVVVCLEESIYVHNIRDMKVLHTIRDTPPNPLGLIDLTSTDVSHIAYPGSATVGEVHIFDGANLQAVTTISAHDSPLAALRFNADGTKLATASARGTVIRVFDTTRGDKLFEFRRGVKRCVTIFSLAFSVDSLYLCSSSNTETLHVFKLDAHHRDEDTRSNADEDESTTTAGGVGGGAGATAHAWMDYMSKTAATYLPTQMTDIFQQDRSFATAKVPAIGRRNVVALTAIKQKVRLLVATYDGYLYIYDIQPEGGECSLVKQHKFANWTSAKSGASSATMASTGIGGDATTTAIRSYAGAVATTSTHGGGDEDLAHAVAGVAHQSSRLHLEDSAEFPPMTHSTD